MLARLFGFAGLVTVAALTLPGIATTYLDRSTGQAQPATPAVAVRTAAYAAGKGVVLPADRTGHFSATFSINGRKENGLVDTGASLMAINVSTARRFGISQSALRFDASVGTANGVVNAARVTLDRVEIGSIAVRDVAAVVLPDRALSGTLVGMSFLNRLSSYRVENGHLHLFR